MKVILNVFTREQHYTNGISWVVNVSISTLIIRSSDGMVIFSYNRSIRSSYTISDNFISNHLSLSMILKGRNNKKKKWRFIN